MYDIFIEKVKIPFPVIFTKSPYWFKFLVPDTISRISVFLFASFAILFIWYLGEVYFTFKLGYEIREKQVLAKNLETEYLRNKTAFIHANSAELILQSQVAKSMLDVSSLKYLQSKSYFVEARKELP